MKKITLTIASIILCVSYGVLSWDIVTHSATPGPEDSKYAGICSSTTKSDRGGPSTNHNMCCIDYNGALDAVKRDWHENLDKLKDQEKRASDMVAEGYESLRTYNCWVEYICRAVLYSGHAPIESALGTGLKEVHLGIVPGCQAPDNLRMESEYNQFVKDLKDIPIVKIPVGAGEIVVDTFEDIMAENKINYFPRCQTDENNNNNSPNLIQARTNYDACKRDMELHFGCPKGSDKTTCPESSNAFVTLENVLKTAHADQKASALERKLGTIVTKLHAMEEHVGYLSTFLKSLDSRLKCYAAKCD